MYITVSYNFVVFRNVFENEILFSDISDIATRAEKIWIAF